MTDVQKQQAVSVPTATLTDIPASAEPVAASEQPADKVTKIYTALNSIPTGNTAGQTPIKMCSAILPNHMQCWKAGAYLVTVLKNSIKDSTYQLCRAHAVIDEAEYTGRMASKPEATAEGTVKAAAEQGREPVLEAKTVIPPAPTPRKEPESVKSSPPTTK